MRLAITPLTLREANALIAALHRHHKPAVGHRFSIGVDSNGKIVAAAIVGRPVSREIDHHKVAEVTRLVSDGTPHTCSMLYAACARIAREMGFSKIQTYILDTEPGTSLVAAGWSYEAMTKGGTWNNGQRKGRRDDQPLVPKQRWSKILKKETGEQTANRSET